jgi:tetratricopeptide (TPR) repeat protein
LPTIYSQLRVSCGLSATINSIQPEETRANSYQTLALWLDTQWLRLTNNNDSSNPLVKLAERREWKWAVVLDYILLRKIRSSFLLCQGVPPSRLVLEVEDEHLDWDQLKPVFLKIITRLHAARDDWPLWHYEGDFVELEENWNSPDVRKNVKKLIQSIKAFYEIFQSNVAQGAEAEWKNIFMNMSGFPEKLTNDHVIFHIDHYKTDFELAGLLETLGFEYDSTYGRAYPKNVVPNSIILINRPEHWVTEDSKNRGVVLDSLTQSTDVVHAVDSFNYFKPKENLRVFRKALPALEMLFPQIEVDIEEVDLAEFPDIDIPETANPQATAIQYHQRAAQAFNSGDMKTAFTEKRIEVALLEKGDKNLHYYSNLLELAEWCAANDKPLTGKETLEKMVELEKTIGSISVPLKIRKQKVQARLYTLNFEPDLAVDALKQALALYKETPLMAEAYDVANSLGVALARAKKSGEAKQVFQQALQYAQKAQKTAIAGTPDSPQKYWPAIIRALTKKIQALPEEKIEEPPAEKPPAIEKVE